MISQYLFDKTKQHTLFLAFFHPEVLTRHLLDDGYFFNYFVRNSVIALLEAVCARM